MSSRRKFIKQIGALVPAVSVLNVSYASFQTLQQNFKQNKDRDPKEVARDEDYWRPIRQCYDPSPHFTNLENGFYSPATKAVMEALCDNQKRINQLTSFYMRRMDGEDRLNTRKLLAEYAGVNVNELLITRSTTESLDTVIMGLDIKPDEEVIIAESDYPNMVAAFALKEKRYGTRLKRIQIPHTPKAPEEVTECYRKAITSKTKFILLTHVINMNGQILPVAEIAKMAHQRGIEVICDASHSYALLDYKISDLDCDYFATSLHKWMGAPVGTGLLYIKKEKIKKVWPLFGDYGHDEDDIRKFERIGTYPAAIYISIANALKFHQSIGTKFKEERLRYLKDYWVQKVVGFSKLKFHTPLDEKQSCAITLFSIEGKSEFEIANYLFDKHKIFTVAYDRGGFNGVRVTPHLYNTISDMDKLVKALEVYCRE